MRPSETVFLGLAPFLRLSVAGVDLLPVGQELLGMAQQNPDDAILWMNLSTAMLCLGQHELGLVVQAQALETQRLYHRAAAQQPARLRVLMLMAAGDLSANTPLDCLLEDSDIDLDFYYVSPGEPLAVPVPEHDVVFVGISASDENSALLTALEQALAHWPKPVVNAPGNIPLVERDAASALLQHAPGLLIPPTLRATRQMLADIAGGAEPLPARFDDCDFPIILRPVGSHAGRDLDRIATLDELTAYLVRVEGDDFFLSRFIDYSSRDGLFRKMRIALIKGVPFACHMAVSAHWMVHYVNADMYLEASKRDEEAAFMAGFDAFAQRHQAALAAISGRTGLDYVCVDCAETPTGELLVFEIDHAMVVHAMDPEDLFPYKQVHMLKVKHALRDFFLSLTTARSLHVPA